MTSLKKKDMHCGIVGGTVDELKDVLSAFISGIESAIETWQYFEWQFFFTCRFATLWCLAIVTREGRSFKSLMHTFYEVTL